MSFFLIYSDKIYRLCCIFNIKTILTKIKYGFSLFAYLSSKVQIKTSNYVFILLRFGISSTNHNAYNITSYTIKFHHYFFGNKLYLNNYFTNNGFT